MLKFVAFFETSKFIVAFTSIVLSSNLMFSALVLEPEPSVKLIVLGSVLSGIINVLLKIFTFSILPLNTASISS